MTPTIAGAYIFSVERLQIRSVIHKYLVRGHTQNEGDAIHSITEKSLTRAKKAGPIYVPDQNVPLIRHAKETGPPLNVREMNFTDFYDLTALHHDADFHWSKDTDGNEFKINDVRLLRFEKGSDTFQFKTSYEQQEWKRIRTFQG